MMRIQDYLKTRLQKAVLEKGFVSEPLYAIELSPCKQKSHGDLATNAAFSLAKQNRRSPREVAQDIVDALIVEDDWIDNVEIAGAGFINFTFARPYLDAMLQEILDHGERFGTAVWGDGKKTQVEFVSANPTGPLTIGHGRQAVLGDTIARLLSATGHTVMREYYYNDAGRQMRILGDSLFLRYK